MSERTTRADLERLVDRINMQAGTPLSYPRANNYHIDIANGGYALHQVCSTGHGSKDVFSAGRHSKRELRELCIAFLAGMSVPKAAQS